MQRVSAYFYLSRREMSALVTVCLSYDLCKRHIISKIAIVELFIHIFSNKNGSVDGLKMNHKVKVLSKFVLSLMFK